MLTHGPAQLPEDGGDIEPEAPDTPRPPAAEWSVQMTRADYSIHSMHRRFKDGSLIRDPDLARASVWDLGAKSRLVESVLLRIPLPAFYLSEELDGTLTVLDGQRRLDALFSFMDGQFRLEGLPLLWDLEGRDFESLPPRLRRRFTDTALTCLIMLSGTSPEIKYEFFRRVNTGAIPWSAQEIRNALFRGPGLDLVRELADEFRALAGRGRALPRMTADELVLRALAFLAFGEARYTGGIQSFLSDALNWLNRLPPAQLFEVKARFTTALERISSVFGEHAFCRYFPEEGRWSQQLSRPLIEVLFVGFDRRFPAGAPFDTALAPAILERFKRMYEDHEFRGAVTTATQVPAAVRKRIQMWTEELSHVD